MKNGFLVSILTLGVLGAVAIGALAWFPDTTYDVRNYTHNGDGSGKAMASLGNDAAHMYEYERLNDGTTRFCLEDVLVELCFTTEDRFNPGSGEHQRLNFTLEQ